MNKQEHDKPLSKRALREKRLINRAKHYEKLGLIYIGAITMVFLSYYGILIAIPFIIIGVKINSKVNPI